MTDAAVKTVVGHVGRNANWHLYIQREDPQIARFNEAMRSLEEGRTFAELARELGYSCRTTFAKAFRDRFSLGSPQQLAGIVAFQRSEGFRRNSVEQYGQRIGFCSLMLRYT